MLSRKAAATAGIMMLLMASVLIATEYSVSGPDSFSGAASRRSQTTAPTAVRTSNSVSTTPTAEALPPPPALRVHLELPPQCRDKILNGEETDVDCGGSQCPACDFNLVCALDRDCKSHNCLNGRCGPEPCELGASRCELDSAGNPSGYLQVCKESRQGFQRGELCANGCLNGKCIAPCSDSDGNDINTQGFSSGVSLNDIGGIASEQRDFCTGSFVQEFTCQSDSLGRKGLVQTGIECPNGCADGACTPCAANIGQPCNRNQCGGTGVYSCDGSCTATEPQLKFAIGTVGDPCNRNECGGEGVVGCTGTCSALPEPLNFPIGKVGSACNRNECGGTGVVKCGGTCSVVAPQIQFPLGKVGSSCGCGGTIKCDGTCSAILSCPTGQTCDSVAKKCVAACVPKCADKNVPEFDNEYLSAADVPYYCSSVTWSDGCGGICRGGKQFQNGQWSAWQSMYPDTLCRQVGGTELAGKNWRIYVSLCPAQCGGTCPQQYSQKCTYGESSCSNMGNPLTSGNRMKYVDCAAPAVAPPPPPITYTPIPLPAPTCTTSTVRECYSSSPYSVYKYQYRTGTKQTCSSGTSSVTWNTPVNCPSGQTCNNGYCASSTTAAPPSDPCPGTQGCCCQYGYPDCASGYECRGWSVPGHQSFGTCTPRGSLYASQLNGAEAPYCGK